MKLSDWAKKKGISYLTAYRWFKSGKIKATQYASGTIIVDENITHNDCSNVKENIVIYCRVSNLSRKKELEYQVERCEQYCISKGYQISKIYKEIASGMNDNRSQLIKMFNNNPTRIVVENKDRLTRFGFNYIDYFLKKINCELEVINLAKEDEEDLMKDLVSIITSFCCRLYGLRRSKNKIHKIKSIINE